MKSVQVMVVDDHPFFRNGVIAWLKQQQNFEVCAEADSIADAKRGIERFRPDLVLLDLHLRDGDGLDLLRELTLSAPELHVVVLTQCDEGAFAHRALRAGAHGYVMKSQATETLLLAIQTVLQGEIFVSRTVKARLLHNLSPDVTARNLDLARLSDREVQVFQLLGSGANNREIALLLKISVKTVETYREHLKEKLQLADAGSLLQSASQWVRSGEFRSGAIIADRFE